MKNSVAFSVFSLEFSQLLGNLHGRVMMKSNQITFRHLGPKRPSVKLMRLAK